MTTIRYARNLAGTLFPLTLPVSDMNVEEWVRAEMSLIHCPDEPHRIILFPPHDSIYPFLVQEPTSYSVSLWTSCYEWEDYRDSSSRRSYYQCHIQINKREDTPCEAQEEQEEQKQEEQEQEQEEQKQEEQEQKQEEQEEQEQEEQEQEEQKQKKRLKVRIPCFETAFLYDIHRNQFILESDGMWEHEVGNIYICIDENTPRYNSIYEMVDTLTLAPRIKYSLVRSLYRKWSRILRQFLHWIKRWPNRRISMQQRLHRRNLMKMYRIFRETPPPYSSHFPYPLSQDTSSKSH